MNGFEDRGGEPDGEKPENGPEMQEQSRIMVLPVNGDSKKVTQTLSNETSLKILELLGKNSMSATDIADELKIPLTTVKYNLESLVDSELIKVKQIKWSRKGREVKVYEAMEKLIVLVPSKAPVDKLSIINLLQQYLGIIAAAVFAAAGIEYFSAYMRAKKIIDATAPLRMGMKSSLPEPFIEGGNETENCDTGNLTLLNTNFTSSVSVLDQNLQNASSNKEYFAGNGSSEPVEVTGTAAEEAVKVQGENVEGIPQTENTSTPAEAPVETPDQGISSPENSSGTQLPSESGSGAQLPSDDGGSGAQLPSEGLGALNGYHGIYDALSVHPGVWFLFGCIFVIFLIIVRQVYYKKKSK